MVKLPREQLTEEIGKLLLLKPPQMSSQKKKKKGSGVGSGADAELTKKVREALKVEGALVEAVLAEHVDWLPSVVSGWKGKDFESR